MRFTKNNSQMIKGVAILLMIFHHLFAFPERIAITYSNPISIFIFSEIGSFSKICVSLFCFITGYGIYKKSYKNNMKKFVVKDIVMGKTTIYTFYKQYWLVIFIFIPLGFLLDKLHFSVKSILLSFLGFSQIYNIEWWYVKDYLLFIGLFPLYNQIIKLIDNQIKSEKIQIFVYFSLLFGLAFTSELLYNFPIYKVTRWIPCFLIGLIFAKFNLFTKINKTIPPLFSILLILGVICLRNISNPTTSSNHFDFLLAPILILACCSLLKKKDRYFQLLGKYSLYMWLTHSFYIYYYFQRIVLLAHYPFLIYLWVIILSIVTAKILEFLSKILYILKKYKKLIL